MKLNKIIRKLTNKIRYSKVKYLKLENYQKGMQITTKLREIEDHFAVTIYNEDRQKFDVSVGDIIIFRLDKHELIRPIRKDFHVSLPKNLLKNKEGCDKIKLSVLKIAKRDDCLERPKKMVKNNKLDIRFFIPEKTKYGYPLYVIDRDPNYSSVWYPIGGGVGHINIKNFADIDTIAGLMGFYFGDGSTCESMKSFRLTNCEPSVLNCCLDVFGGLGMSRDCFKIQLIYSTDKEVTKEIKYRCIEFWSKSLGINKGNIVSVSKAKNVRETLRYGSARLSIDSTVLVEIFLHGLLKGILPRITNPQNNEDEVLIKGFMRGLLAAEGSMYLNNYGSIVKVGIAFDPHSNELELYKKLLKNLSIGYGKAKGNEIYIYGYNNIRKLFEINAFKMHRKRNQKFVRGFLQHKLSNQT